MRTLLKLLFIVPSLVDIAAGNSTSEDQKPGSGSSELPTARLQETPSAVHERDRRMTHWDSRSRLNFDNKGRNENRGRTTHTTSLEDPSVSRIPVNFETAQRSSRPHDEGTSDTSEDEKFEGYGCLDDVIISQPIVPWMLFPATGNNPLEMTSSNPRKLSIQRCRRTIQGWSIEEPIYVEEPRWILIEMNRENSGGRTIHNRDDPFYVARGKRSEKPGKRLLVNGIGSLFSSMLTEGNRQAGYVQPRNKHSDILDILNEPFFISRGKKNTLGIQRSRINDDYTTEFFNIETRRGTLGSWRPNQVKKNCNPNFSNCRRPGMTNDEEPPSEPFRDRRGFVEELLKEAEPFYVARGKKSFNRIED